MENQNSMKYFSIGVVLFVVGGIVGVVADPYLPASLSSAKKSYQSGFAAARKVAEESQYGNLFKTPDDIRFVGGTVTAVSGNRLTVHSQLANPFADPALSDRTVLVTADTKIVKFVAKDPKVYQEELATFKSSTESKVAGATSPLPTTRIAVDVSSITVGMVVAAVASENIKTMKEFTATEIQIQHKLTFSK